MKVGTLPRPSLPYMGFIILSMNAISSSIRFYLHRIASIFCRKYLLYILLLYFIYVEEFI